MRGTENALTDKAGFSLSTAGILAIWHQLTAAIVTASTIGKLLKDAESQHARHAVIIESDQVCNVKNLDTGEQRENIALTELPAHLA